MKCSIKKKTRNQEIEDIVKDEDTDKRVKTHNESDSTSSFTSLKLAHPGPKQLTSDSDYSETDTMDTDDTKILAQPKIGSFLTKTTNSQKRKIDEDIAAYFFARNIPFSHSEDYYFKKMVNSLRPGYTPPNRRALSGEMLDSMEAKISTNMAEQLKGQTVTLIQDGWSNIHNQPVLANCLFDGKHVYFLSAFNTGSNEKTATYCKEVAKMAIKEASEKFGCKVTSFVSDNEAKMKKMRSELEAELKTDGNFFLAYGCAAHYLNLLGGDICKKKNISVILGHITELSKYFRNHHKANALLLAQKGARKPQLPCDTRWNSQVDCLDIFLKNRPHYMQLLMEDGGHSIDKNIQNIISNVALFVDAKYLHSQLSLIARALDAVQRDCATLADATFEFIKLKKEECLQQYKEEIEKRYRECITPFHKLAYMLHHKYMGEDLDDDDLEQARAWAAENCDKSFPFPPLITLFLLKQKPFPQSFFTEKMRDLQPVFWWEGLSRYKAVDPKFIEFVTLLHKCCASSAGIERIFCNFSFIQSKLRNQLGLEKCSKLVRVYRMLNLKSGSKTKNDFFILSSCDEDSD